MAMGVYTFLLLIRQHLIHPSLPPSLPSLDRTIQSLRTETLQLSAQNDLMRQQLATSQRTKYTPKKEELEKENKELRNALLLALQALGEDEGEDEEGEEGVVEEWKKDEEGEEGEGEKRIKS